MNRLLFVLFAASLMLWSACGDGETERRRNNDPVAGTCEPACGAGFSCVRGECYVQVRPEDCGENEEFDPRLRVCLTPLCDDGEQNGEEEGVDCGGACEACLIPDSCGDGQVDADAGEQCDHGGTIQLVCFYGETSCEVCNAQCELVPGQVSGFCGDGEVQAGGGEECDHGGSPETSCPVGEESCELCAADCKLVSGDAAETCGDGVINGDDACDGAALNGASCTSLGLPAGELSCAADCTYDTSSCVDMDAIVELALGYSHTCVRHADGSVSCWGRNDDGRVGDDSTMDRASPTPVLGLNDAVQISAGGYHTCAIRQNGTVVCWGRNDDGQLGDGTTTQRLIPRAVPGLAHVTAITTGTWHTCAITNSGTVYCWGSNQDGQLGDGSTSDVLSPVQVTLGLSDATQIDAGKYHTCARSGAQGQLACWGRNTYGELGDPGFVSSQSSSSLIWFHDAEGDEHLVAESVGLGDSFTCARTSAGQVYCVGRNDVGQLGTGVSGTPYYAGLVGSGFAQLSVGEHHACGLNNAGTVSCWGTGLDGRLGLGTTRDWDRPQTLAMSAVLDVQAGGMHSCARLQDGRVMCWGRNSNGQLGQGIFNDRYEPTVVPF